MGAKPQRVVGDVEKGTWQGANVVVSRWKTIWTVFCYLCLFLFVLLLLPWQRDLLDFEPQKWCTQAACARNSERLPQYVLNYAPLVWLDESESFFPADISAQVENTHPEANFTTITDVPEPLTLKNLDALNSFGNEGSDVFLTSTVDVTTKPTWLEGVVPDSTGKTNGASSCAIIVNDRGFGRVDAFYMYFYAYNQGNTVFSRELGNHIGDWEHNMIRFQDGVPQAVWFSQHYNGQAFTYRSVEKQGLRTISYSARGSHANYATSGSHDHSIPEANLPFGFIVDHTSRGTLWDPTLTAYFYTYNAINQSFSAANEQSPPGAMQFRGQWGDEQYPEEDNRQGKPFFGWYKYVSGPTGPYDKDLDRKRVCLDNGIPCIVRKIRVP